MCTAGVVLVGDDVALVRSLSIGLRVRGYEVAVVPSLGNLAHPRAGDAAVVVVVMGSSGGELDVLRELRRHIAGAVVALSVHHDELHRTRAREAGAEAFLTIPFSMDELVRLIDHVSPVARTAPTLN